MGASGQVRRLKVDASVRGSGFCDKVGDSLRPPRTRSSSSEGAEASPTSAEDPGRLLEPEHAAPVWRQT